VGASIEAGYRLGKIVHRRSPDEIASSTSTIAGSVLGLLAFILAFTFGIVTNRYDARKVLVREEANAIGTAYLRSDFLPEADRAKAAALFREYVDSRLKAAQHPSAAGLEEALLTSARIQPALWTMAVTNARKELDSDIGALYIQALNTVIDFHSSRLALIHARIPIGIWLVLYALIILSMFGLGYQTAIADSRRSWIMPVLALAFSIVITLIYALDSTHSTFIAVSQQPLMTLQEQMAADVGKPAAPGRGSAQ
jgi:hypothetical protein